MNSLIKIDVNENYEQVVSARELHEKLGIGKDFTDWFKYQTERLNLSEEIHFTTILGKSTGGRPSTDYLVPLEIAKHLCMISGGEMAWQIRDYFIQIERAWNTPEQVMARALQMSRVTIDSLQDRVAALLPKAKAHDHFLAATNAQTMNVAAKSLGIGRNKLFEFLRHKKLLMRNNIPYQEYLGRGYFEVIEKTIDMGTGVINKPQTLVTAKGIDYIGRMLKEGEQVATT